jgi:hypothetical protein
MVNVHTAFLILDTLFSLAYVPGKGHAYDVSAQD